MRYGVGPFPPRVGLWQGGLNLRVPSLFRDMRSETKPWLLVVFEGILKRLRLKTRIAVSSHANCPWLSSIWTALRPALSTSESLELAHVRFRGAQRAIATLSPIAAIPKSLNIRGGVVVPLSQSQTYAVFHLRTSQSPVVSGTNRFWLGSTWRASKEERSEGYTVKSQNTSSKLLSSCAIISCSFFSFSCKSTPGKDSRLPN